MKRFKMAHGLIGVDDEPIKTPVKIAAATATAPAIVEEWGETTADIFLYIMNNVPFRTNDDAIQGGRLYIAIKEAKKAKAAYLEIEDGVHDWLKIIAKDSSAQLYRVNGDIVYRFVMEGFEKAHEPQPKSKEK